MHSLFQFLGRIPKRLLKFIKRPVTVPIFFSILLLSMIYTDKIGKIKIVANVNTALTIQYFSINCFYLIPFFKFKFHLLSIGRSVCLII